MKHKLHLLFEVNYKRQSLVVFCLALLFPVFVLNSCIDDTEEQPVNEDITVKDLIIPDPTIWNTLATQAILPEDTEEKSASRSANNLKEYPSGKNYYYTLFEDLYPGEGDYDFNDIVLKTKALLGFEKKMILGTLKTQFVHRGGSVIDKIGLMIYESDGKNKYKRIPNKNITINGENMGVTDKPYSFEIGQAGESWEIGFEFEQPSMEYVWIGYFVITKEGQEILTSGFPKTELMEAFEIPQKTYLTDDNKPWGLEIEASEMPIVAEKANFCKAFPDFVLWVNNPDNNKYKKWYENPNKEYIQVTK